jgi:hypothetical protein
VIERTQVNGNYYLLGGFQLGRELSSVPPLEAPESRAPDSIPYLVYAERGRTVVVEDIAPSDSVVGELPQPVRLGAVLSAKQMQSI